MRKMLLAALVAAPLLSGCNIIKIAENFDEPFDIDPPTILVVVLDPETNDEGTPQERCDHMGGHYEVNTVDLTEECFNTDY